MSGGSDVEENRMPSATVPDQSLTVREILERFTRGLMPPISRELTFSEDAPDLRGLEPWQITEMLHENRSEINALQAEIQRRQKEKTLADKQQSDPPTPEIPT